MSKKSNVQMKKVCSKCKEAKYLNEFAANKSKKDGKHTFCRDCHKIYRREHYLKNRKKYIDLASKYQKNKKR